MNKDRSEKFVPRENTFVVVKPGKKKDEKTEDPLKKAASDKKDGNNRTRY